jgi:uncharacterized protein YbgA (DUF1722 family)/uncharacterized protein YbbK (DUF523 family)
VRFDAGHKRDSFLVDTLGPFVEFVHVCPELELGLGVPRETLRLEQRAGETRLVAPASQTDHTRAMRAYVRRRVAALERENLSGYVLKKNSPSCGMERVRVFSQNSTPSRDGRGLFAEALIAHFPHLPVEEEGRLNDARLRENFIERVFAYHRLRAFFATGWTIGGLVAFHTRHKLQLLTHSPRIYAQLGRTVAAGRALDRTRLRSEYMEAFMSALEAIPTPARHVNVLQHAAGYFREHLDREGRSELARLIEDYQGGLVPLIVPITLIRHYARLFNVAYLADQVYLDPHPRELMLRNHV